jgi:2-oxoglutarate ferredoxin oxidoreductase subunit gamma
MANIVALGSLSILIPSTPSGGGVVSREAMEAAVMERIPKGTEKLNKLAFEEGVKAAAEIQKTLVFEEPPEDSGQI